jgi:hypothetical protein
MANPKNAPQKPPPKVEEAECGIEIPAFNEDDEMEEDEEGPSEGWEQSEE